MELRDYLLILRKHWISIAVLGVLGFCGAFGASSLTTPMYTASTQLYVSVQGGTTTSELLQGSSFTRQQVASYTRLVTTPLVLGPVIDELSLDTRADALAGRVVSDSPLNSSLIDIRVSDPSPAMAAAVANAVAAEFRDVVSDLEQPTDGGPSNVKLTVVRTASAPTAPSEPNTRLNLALGLAAGLSLGVLIAVLRELLDNRVRSEATVEQITGASVIGAIVFDGDAGAHPLIVQSDPHSPRAEAFRRLRTNVQFLDVADRPSSILVTSSVPGEGKSTTTINLAITLADAGTRTVLVDADLRRPAVARYLGIEGSVGLTTVLIGQAQYKDVIQPFGNGFLDVLPSGQVPPNPSELLGSSAMSKLLETLTAEYDVVLVDTPPLLPVTDAAVLSRVAGGVIVLVGAGVVTRGQLTEALGNLETVDAHVLGVVVNREPRRQDGGAYSYYRYDSDTSQRRSGSRKAPDRESRARAQASPPVATVPTDTASTAVWPGEVIASADARGRESIPPQHIRGGGR